MGKHSFLSASASHRWINCPPSARLCEEYADRPSEYAQEGTDCHELCAYKVEKALGRRVKDPTENLTYYSQEMGRTPPWIKGLNLRADGYETMFYKKD